MRNKTIAITLILLVLLISHRASAERYEETLFQDALNLYRTLVTDPVKINEYEIWDTIAQSFYAIYTTYPRSKPASESLFLAGKMYEEMGTRFNSREDYNNSIQRSREFTNAFPTSDHADDAQIRIARILEMWDKAEAYKEYEKVVQNYPKGDMVYAAGEKLKDLKAYKVVTVEPPKDTKVMATIKRIEATQSKAEDIPEDTSRLARINQIRHWSTESYSRIVIQANREVPYDSRFLKPDPELNTPPRIYVDIKDSTVDLRLKTPIIDNGLLSGVRFGRNTPTTVRVVLDVNSLKDYKVFALHNPFRIVMDVYGQDKAKMTITKQGTITKQKVFSSDDDRTFASLPRLDEENISVLRGALGLKVRTIVIDPGHGGHDPGAIGPTGLKEKDVTLAIGKALKQKIEEDGREFGITRVVMTRDDDRFIPLEERTGIARKQNADIFISIHCNAARNRDAFGIETYILSFTKDPEALAVAARENSTTSKGISDLKDIIKKYLLSSKLDESNRLATHVLGSVITGIAKKYNQVKSKGVKKAPFIVLIGADIPSILVETSFITNPREEQRLRDSDYISDMANGIFAGIKKYSNEVETASISEH